MPNARNDKRARTGCQSVASPNDNQPAALRGATLAFAARTERPSAPTTGNSDSGDNGALKAAVFVGGPPSPGRRSPRSSQHPEHDSSSTTSVSDRIKLFSAEGAGSTPSQYPRSTPNTQHVAAQLAVDRYAARAADKPSTKLSGNVVPQSLGKGNPMDDPVPGAEMQRDESISTPSAERGLRDETNSSGASIMPQLRPSTPPRARHFEPSQSPESSPGSSFRGDDKRLLPPRVLPPGMKTSGQASPGPDPINGPTAHGMAGLGSRSTPRMSPLQAQANAPEHASVSSKSTMADAMAASSLASSRAASPSKQDSGPPPPPPHRLTRSRSSLHPTPTGRSDASRTPSPSKSLRKTLRDEPKSDNESGRTKQNHHHRRRIMRPHPHKKHNEDSRKRWRDSVTEGERRRYEGVWAANKGLVLKSDSLLQDMVVNVVVRDIWSRSRLPSSLLAQIWDLVSHDAEAMVLSREEFVVGMWLIDQCLQGRKLSWRVSENVWESVQHVPGIQVPKFRP